MNNTIRQLLVLGFLLFFHFLLLFKLQFTAWPEMFSYPYLMSQGYTFYADIIHPDMPLLLVVLMGVFKFVGFNLPVLQAFTWLLILLTDVLVFTLSKKLYNVSLAYLLTFIYLLFQTTLEGNGLWFDLAVTPFLLGSFYFLLTYSKGKKQKNLVWAAIQLGLALLIKLSAIWIVVPLIIYIFFKYRQQVVYFIFPIVVSFLFGLVVIDSITDLGSFFQIGYWGIYYPLFVMARMPGYIQPASFSQLVRILLVFLPFVVLLPQLFKREDVKKQLIAIFFVGSLFFGIHRFSYFHFQPAIPFFVLLMGYGFRSIQNRTGLKKGVLVGIFGISFFTIVLMLTVAIKRSWNQEPRFFDSALYNESARIKATIPTGDTAYFHNTPSQYIVASGVLPSKPWADTFAWYLEVPGVQNTIIKAIEEDNVQWVIQSDFNTGDRYDLGVYNPTIIDRYIHSHFDRYTAINQRITIYKRK